MVNASSWREQLQAKVKVITDKHLVWHDLRHYYASKMLSFYGHDIWTVFNLMGHSDISITQKTYGHWIAEVLSSENKKQLWIPEGFAHGYYVLSETAELVYKANNFYSKEHEKTIHWKNNLFSIEWPIKNNIVLLSKKDDFS